MRCLDGITDSMKMSLTEMMEIVQDFQLLVEDISWKKVYMVWMWSRSRCPPAGA